MFRSSSARTAADSAANAPIPDSGEVPALSVPEQIVEIVSDSGEGAQTAGQIFGTVCAKMGNGLWTVEIIPAEIEPPARSRAGASGIRIRFGTKPVASMGDQADLVVAFNEQVLYSRIDQGALRPGTLLLIDDKWSASDDPKTREVYQKALEDFHIAGYIVREIPIHAETHELTDNPQRGKNMWVVGLLCALYSRDLDLAKREVQLLFQRKRKGEDVIALNHKLLDAGHAWAVEHIDARFEVPSETHSEPMVVMNGNAAIALGAMAAGIEVCSMYPITPATSASHYLAADFHHAGGIVHQAEDEIAAVGFAIGASFAGKTALTITSGPGMALKSEFLGLSVMAEVPLVVVDVQRGRRRAEGGDGTVEPRGVLPLHGDGAQARRELPHAGLRALGREPRDGPGLPPTPERERGVAVAAHRPVALEGGCARLWMGS
jgi:2-oxoglutarate ferredoxin oxidoreductase subunit alpha